MLLAGLSMSEPSRPAWLASLSRTFLLLHELFAAVGAQNSETLLPQEVSVL